MATEPQQAHYGDATLTVDLHDGLIEYVLVIENVKMRITDQQARDATHCFADFFPYSYTHPASEPSYTRAVDNGDPAATLPEGVDGYPMCRQCGHKFAQIPAEAPAFCGDECEHNWRGSEYRGWYTR